LRLFGAEAIAARIVGFLAVFVAGQENSIEPIQSASESARLPLADAEYQHVIAAGLVLERVAGFAHQVGDVDFGQRIGALDHQDGAGRQARQGLAGAQRRQRALEAAQVDDGGAGGGVGAGSHGRPRT
jgi:hypothetical protein